MKIFLKYVIIQSILKTGIERGANMKKEITVNGDCLRVTISNCTPAEFLQVIGRINLPGDVHMTCLMDSNEQKAFCTIRCESAEDLESLRQQLL